MEDAALAAIGDLDTPLLQAAAGPSIGDRAYAWASSWWGGNSGHAIEMVAAPEVRRIFELPKQETGPLLGGANEFPEISSYVPPNPAGSAQPLSTVATESTEMTPAGSSD